MNPEKEHFIKGHEYIADILSMWERDKRSSVTMTKYSTISHKPSFSAALGGGDSRFVFRKRLFRKPKEIPEDPVEYHLMYAQAVHSVVKVRVRMMGVVSDINGPLLQLDEFPVNENVAFQLAGLQAQVLYGDYDPNMGSRYDEVEQFLPERLIVNNRTQTREDLKKGIAEAHKVLKIPKPVNAIIKSYTTLSHRNMDMARQRYKPKCGT